MIFFKSTGKTLYLFKDKLFCNQCKEQLICVCTNKPEKTYLYYTCNSKSCKHYKKKISEEKVMAIFLNELNALLIEYKKIFSKMILNLLIHKKEKDS